MIATNRSRLLVRTLLRFAGFHRQPSFGLLRGLSYLEVCKSSSTSGIYMWWKISAFRNSLLYFWFCSFVPVSCVIGFYIGHSHSISRHRPLKPLQKFNMCDFVATLKALVAKAVIVCVHWCLYIVRHRGPLGVLLTHLWKPGFSYYLNPPRISKAGSSVPSWPQNRDYCLGILPLHK